MVQNKKYRRQPGAGQAGFGEGEKDPAGCKEGFKQQLNETIIYLEEVSMALEEKEIKNQKKKKGESKKMKALRCLEKEVKSLESEKRIWRKRRGK